MRHPPSLSSIALLSVTVVLACATAYDEEQVGDMAALSNGETNTGKGGATSASTPSATSVTVSSVTTVTQPGSTSDDSTSTTSATSTTSSNPTTMAASNTSSTTASSFGGSGGDTTTESTTMGTGGSGGDMMGAGGTTTMSATTDGGTSTTAAATPDCPNPLTPTSAGQSGSFATTGEVCYFVPGGEVKQGWGCSEADGRTVWVNGTEVTCGDFPLPAEQDGGYYFVFSAGSKEFTSFYWF